MGTLEWIVAVALVEVTVALLVLIGLSRRLSRVEDRLATPPPEQKDDGVAAALDTLTARVAELAAGQDRLARWEGLEERLPDLSGVEAGIAALAEKTAPLSRLKAIEQSVARALLREPEQVDLDGVLRPMLVETVESLDARLRKFTASLDKEREETRSEMLVRVLGDRGFSEVTVVDTTETGDGATRLVVEAKRDGMSFKGLVLIEDGRVVEQTLRPSYPMFP